MMLLPLCPVFWVTPISAISADGLTIKLVLCTGAGAGVLTYFAGAGACSPPVKL